MSNSPLVNYVKISPNKNSPRKDKIKKITIHHMAGNASVEACGEIFSPVTRQGSSNYGIGSDGRVGMYVEEKDRAWTSSSPENDHQAVTIEVANDSGAPNWHVSNKALAKLIDLCVDICKRNGIQKLNFTGDKSGNLTMHKWFAPTACPGPYLESKFPYIADEVNKRLGVKSTAAQSGSSTSELYRVRKTWKDSSTQKGAFSKLDNAKACTDKNKGYFVFDSKGKIVYPNEQSDTVYIVKSGDTLSKIAAKYNTTYQVIAAYNNIKSPYTIYTNQKIKIPKK